MHDTYINIFMLVVLLELPSCLRKNMPASAGNMGLISMKTGNTWFNP